ncbi:metal-dependent hydrolase [Mangrovivirga cuniculi]|uniref:UPF0173 metal-dependent hydrolase DCC35_00040 n=1 Tax=Mangrovivirga cuniculi TaxID=2715131 RepID=A0A4D7K1Y3_9BACT|nr:metal-dependent hydrolase [Mangrovivirga cuniculi]QCK13254.1 metal-dependent hydrolase [Mangrovivirga cuniculi]QCK16965.1 metal-dependent hydrolase [Mangrovivirga cuniculi]
MKITYYGQSCFMMETAEKSVLFDPFITPNELAKDIDVSSINPDFILISHGHQDHIADAVDIAKRSGAKVVSNFEIISWLEDQGIENGHPMNHGGNWEFEFGKVKYVNAIHSSVLPDGTYGGNPGGFIVESDGYSIYFAGDTALHMDMQLIPQFTNLDLAIMPIGDNFTMGVDDAVVASDFVKCDKVLGVHYDTFPYIEIDHDEAVKKFKEAGKELILLDIGSSMDI